MAAETWTNWAGNVACTPSRRETPADEAAVSAAVRRAARERLPVRCVGSGHSFSPVAASEGVLLSLDPFAGVAAVDTAAGTARLGAGTKISALGEPLRAAGVALANQGDVDVQSVGGAIGTATHGTGSALGSLSSMLRAARVVRPDGGVEEIGPERPELLRAAACSMGLFGPMLEATLAVVPAYRLHERVWAEPADAVMERLDALVGATRHFEFFWRPAGDFCECKALDPTLRAPDPLDGVEGERIDHSFRVFPSVRTRKFVETEWSVPAARGPDCFLAMRALMRRRHPDVQWPVEYRTQAADDTMIGPAQGRATVAISLHQAAELPWQDFFADAQAVALEHGGRPHWGKWHALQARDLAGLYPEWERFLALRRAWDPDGVFLSTQMRALFA